MVDGFVCLFIQSWKRLSINSLGIEACFNSLMTAQYHTLTVNILSKFSQWRVNNAPPELQ